MINTISSAHAKHKIHGLYAISDPNLITDDKLFYCIEQAILGGVRVLQYRNKSASKNLQYQQAHELRALCKHYDVCFIINDDPHLAYSVQADGVHVGKEDGKIADARHILGDQAIIGVSCYNRLENAHNAIAQGADYIAFGRFFPSKTKPHALQADVNLLQQARTQLPIPIVAIGGINRDNAPQLIQYGADSIAVINDLFADNQQIYPTAKLFQGFFHSSHSFNQPI